MRRQLVGSLLYGILAYAGFAQAEEWPTHPVALIIPFAAGGPGDAVGRVLAPALGAALGQTVVIENVGGAGGRTALSRLAKSAPDGYTMSVGNSGTHTFSQILYKNPMYNAVTDFTPVSMITEGGYALVARKELPVKTLPEFIAYAKAHVKTMQFGSAGIGSGTHIVCALLNQRIGVDPTHVPYRATSLAMQDLIAGRIDYICDAIATARPQIDGKTVTPIAVLWLNRSPILPNVPTADEQGLKGFNESSWNAIFLPAGAPAPIVKRLSAALSTALDQPDLRKHMDLLGVNVAPRDRRGPEFLANFVKSEIPRWGPIFTSIGVAGDR